MARYEHRPIYKKSLDLTVYFEKTVAGFSRYHKYTLGTELRMTSREVLRGIIRANNSRERLAELLKLREILEDLLLLVRLAKEVKAFQSFDSYRFAAEEVVGVSRQNEGWIKFSTSFPLPLKTRAAWRRCSSFIAARRTRFFTAIPSCSPKYRSTKASSSLRRARGSPSAILPVNSSPTSISIASTGL